jgi:transposase
MSRYRCRSVFAVPSSVFKGFRFPPEIIVLAVRWYRRLTRGYQLKEELREIFTMPLSAAQRALDEWLAWASRSKLEPFVKLARSIRRYRRAIEATIEWRLTNGLAESNNSAIGRIRTNARGFHKPANFITMIMLERAGLTPPLPWTTVA